MKSIHNYIQMPLHIFLEKNPEFRSYFPHCIFPDVRYIVRISPNTGTVEVGFPDDDWEIH